MQEVTFTFYKNEDLVSVSKYYPYQPIELYRHSANLASSVATPNYETTMYDVTSLSYPDGGSGKVLTGESVQQLVMRKYADLKNGFDLYRI